MVGPWSQSKPASCSTIISFASEMAAAQASTPDERPIATEIEDTGPGIAPEVAARLFEPFATHGKTHGTGLGLSICKRIIEDHRGRLHTRTEPGRGAIFSFALPRPS